jgi:hypothetical protein
METDYLTLSRQYATFLTAAAGVSSTVLALVLSFQLNPKPVLVAALIVATVSCFAGVLMMAETAAFIQESKGVSSGKRLFLLASINIYIGIMLLIFALMLLPVASGKVATKDIKLITGSILLVTIIGELSWMYRSAVSRMPVPAQYKRFPVIVTLTTSAIGSVILHCLVSNNHIPPTRLLQIPFVLILVFTLITLLHFLRTFEDGNRVNNLDVWLFCSAITSSCASLGVLAINNPY